MAEARLDAAGAAEYTFDLHWDLPRVDVPVRAGHVHTGSIAAILEPGATSVLATLPALVFFALLQRRLVGGMLSGAVKG